jgi:TM2 domain-containing membrane protein YozV
LSEDKVKWTLDLIEKLLEANLGKHEILLNIKESLENGEEISEGYKKYLKDRFEELQGRDPPTQIKNNPIPPKTEPEISPDEPEKTSKTKPTADYCRNCSTEIPESSNFCSKCGEPKQPGSESFCPNCGQKIYGNTPCSNCTKSRPKATPMQRPPEWKSEGTTLVLSIVLGLFGLPGIGHIYVGQVGKGIGILIGSLILFVLGWVTIAFGVGAIFLIIYIIIFFWQIFNSRTVCREYNDYLERTGKKPW